MTAITHPYRTHDPELATLLRQAKAIRSDIRYVIVEIAFGDMSTPIQFWAHGNVEAWAGETPEALLADIRESVSKTEAA